LPATGVLASKGDGLVFLPVTFTFQFSRTSHFPLLGKKVRYNGEIAEPAVWKRKNEAGGDFRQIKGREVLRVEIVEEEIQR
jgi:hypothetical protein